jgi:hypothetical protein
MSRSNPARMAIMRRRPVIATLLFTIDTSSFIQNLSQDHIVTLRGIKHPCARPINPRVNWSSCYEIQMMLYNRSIGYKQLTTINYQAITKTISNPSVQGGQVPTLQNGAIINCMAI